MSPWCFVSAELKTNSLLTLLYLIKVLWRYFCSLIHIFVVSTKCIDPLILAFVVSNTTINDHLFSFCVVLLCVFTFWVLSFDISDNLMFVSSLPPVQLFVGGLMSFCRFVWLYIVVSNTYCVVFLFCLSSSCTLCWRFLWITPSVFSNIYLDIKPLSNEEWSFFLRSFICTNQLAYCFLVMQHLPDCLIWIWINGSDVFNSQNIVWTLVCNLLTGTCPIENLPIVHCGTKR